MHMSAMKVTSGLILLCLWLDMGDSAAHTAGLKCGAAGGRGSMDHALRVVGGTEAHYGSHPWLVSLKSKGSHFCGGAILTEGWVMTAAHCFTSTSRDVLARITVVVGEFDQRSHDEEEQTFVIKSVWVHEEFRPAFPMCYDIALVELEGRIQTGTSPCPANMSPFTRGEVHTSSQLHGSWLGQGGGLAAVLREVRLDLVDQARCKHVLDTVRTSMYRQAAGQPRPAFTALCAGPERGGKDACQGDSGGPLVCRAPGSGRWVAVGVTSWGKGCGRSWWSNRSRPPARRGSPGVFTDVRLLLPWIRRTLRAADGQHKSRNMSKLCGVRDGPVPGSFGIIRSPAHPGRHYSNNELCVWSIRAPPGYSILLEFEHLDLENDSRCLYDRLTVAVGAHGPVGMYCGSVPPGPVLLNNSQSATLSFSSDVSTTGSGFVVRHRAVRTHISPGFKCYGTLVVVDDQTIVHSPNYPDGYSNNFVFHWVIYAPQGHVVKLDFEDFDLEESDGCLYDALVVLGSLEGADPLAVLCGRSAPPSVLSYGQLMVLHFTTDATLTHRGFTASLAFINRAELHSEERSDTEARQTNRTGQQTDTQTDLQTEGQTGGQMATRDDLSASSWRTQIHVSMTPPGTEHLLVPTVGGEASEERALPWMVNLLLDTELICTGVLVQALWILAPGRCTAGLDTGSIGALAVETPGAGMQRSLVARVILHPGYNATSWAYNAALLRLASPLQQQLTEHAQIVYLHERHGNQHTLPAQVGTVCGRIPPASPHQKNITVHYRQTPVKIHVVGCGNHLHHHHHQQHHHHHHRHHTADETVGCVCVMPQNQFSPPLPTWGLGAALVCQRAADSGLLLLGLWSGVAALGEPCGSGPHTPAAAFTPVAALRDWIQDRLRVLQAEQHTELSSLGQHTQDQTTRGSMELEAPGSDDEDYGTVESSGLDYSHS